MPAATGERDLKTGMEPKLGELVDRLKRAFDQQLLSVILYGSAASGDWNEHSSDFNVLCVLEALSADELRRAEPVVRWWRQNKNPSPLFLTESELLSSTDCYPMEFRDMQQHRRVLHGRDLIETLSVDHKFYRAQVEQELRSKQLRFRQRAAELLSQPAGLRQLMIESVSTFCVLGRHALVLAGLPPRWHKSEIVSALSAATGKPLDGLSEILTLRTSGKKVPDAGIAGLLDRYLIDIAELVSFVDRLQA